MHRLPNRLPIIEPRLGRVEVLNGPERHRRWSDQEKASIIAESLAPNANGAAVARRYGMHPNQLYGWRREFRLMHAAGSAGDFVPVTIAPEANAVGSTAIEVCLDGTVVRVVPGVDLALLAEVLRIVKVQG